MRVYDADSTGFWPGEGCGMVVLMRDADARARGCAPYADVRGWGISSDGKGGITRPEVAGQAARCAAPTRAGFELADVALIEGHGTGTAVGDAAELAALNRASAAARPGRARLDQGQHRPHQGRRRRGGLIKAMLAVHRRVLPPTTGCADPAPAAGPGRSGLRAAGRAGRRGRTGARAPG